MKCPDCGGYYSRADGGCTRHPDEDAAAFEAEAAEKAKRDLEDAALTDAERNPRIND